MKRPAKGKSIQLRKSFDEDQLLNDGAAEVASLKL